MLSDEEKKEYIEHEILDRLYCLEENDFDKNKVDDGYIKAVLNACKEAKNLIEKQSKEIEELKEENLIQRKRLNDAFDRGWIHEDKIKAKIEELNDLNSSFAQRVINAKEFYLTELVQNILQSLLEKE